MVRWVRCAGNAPNAQAVLSRCCPRISPEHGNVAAVIVYAVVDDALSLDFPLGVELEVFVRREDA